MYSKMSHFLISGIQITVVQTANLSEQHKSLIHRIVLIDKIEFGNVFVHHKVMPTMTMLEPMVRP